MKKKIFLITLTVLLALGTNLFAAGSDEKQTGKTVLTMGSW